MSNPVLVDVTRGNIIESRHTGAISIMDESGSSVFSIGNVQQRVFPRSAIKALQAIPLVESGAAEALDFDDAELALACASHNGESVHVNTARVMLMKAGLSEEDLMCGSHWPRHLDDSIELAKTDSSPCPLHNNCSGKHAGFLGLAKVVGVPTANYIDYDHPIQQEIRNILEDLTGAKLSQEQAGIDGCSIPTYAIELDKLAFAFAKFGTGENMAQERGQACETLYEACVNEPYMVAGKERFCTSIMDIFQGRVFVKVGAEGVFCASLPELGYGIALKCDDGTTRGAEVMMATVLKKLLQLNKSEYKQLMPWATQPLKNRRAIHVGDITASEGLLAELKSK
ncbi:asparaginase [Polycladidibacter stylochi]|uniref:asparaginase n=1 Tax=Polycladidibacter stylochi TaxID=1807766 RepID=UPI00083391E8|nr:asparaginase [Pseudovibrio stylochi]